MYDHTDEIEVILFGKIFVRVFVLVLAEWAGQGGTEGSNPAVQGQELLDGGQDQLLIHMCGITPNNTAAYQTKRVAKPTDYALGFLESLPEIQYTTPYDVVKEILPLVSAHASLQEFVLPSIERLVRAGHEVKDILFSDLLRIRTV